MIQNVQQLGGNQSFVLKLREDERFEGFVDCQKFSDIGFFPGNMKTECCSYILFMTHIKSRPLDANLSNRLNLLLLDPFHKKGLKIARFRSFTMFDNNFLKCNDFVVKTVVQSTMKHQTDPFYKIYLWMQMPNLLIRSKLLIPSDVQKVEDSDEQVEVREVMR